MRFHQLLEAPFEPVIVPDDGDVPHAVMALFDADGEAYIRFWKILYKDDGGDPVPGTEELVIQSMASSKSVRGRDMLKWLDAKFNMPINVVEATNGAMGFWDRMQKEGLVHTVDAADGWSSPLEELSVPL